MRGGQVSSCATSPRGTLPTGLSRVLKCADIKEERNGKGVIYLIYKDGEILVETDDLEFVKSYISENVECSVRDARTGKKVPVE
jgi:hypothetical protein